MDSTGTAPDSQTHLLLECPTNNRCHCLLGPRDPASHTSSQLSLPSPWLSTSRHSNHGGAESSGIARPVGTAGEPGGASPSELQASGLDHGRGLTTCTQESPRAFACPSKLTGNRTDRTVGLLIKPRLPVQGPSEGFSAEEAEQDSDTLKTWFCLTHLQLVGKL